MSKRAKRVLATIAPKVQEPAEKTDQVLIDDGEAILKLLIDLMREMYSKGLKVSFHIDYGPTPSLIEYKVTRDMALRRWNPEKPAM